MFQSTRHFITELTDLLYPNYLTCGLCGDDLTQTSHFCSSCLSEALISQSITCSTCGRPIDVTDEQHKLYFGKCKQCQENYYYFKKHQAFTLYESGAKRMLLALKYKRETQHLSVIVSGLEHAAESIGPEDLFDMIVPVPIHKRRERIRGFNQAELFTREMAKRMAIPSVAVLERIKTTKKLKNLDKTSRKLALKNAIIVKNDDYNKVANKRILLVDDIFTTGETLNVCAKALYEANASEIYAVTFAMGNDV